MEVKPNTGWIIAASLAVFLIAMYIRTEYQKGWVSGLFMVAGWGFLAYYLHKSKRR